MARRWPARTHRAVFGPWGGTELYANAGMGFHSNDARGAVISVDPLSGEAAERVTPLVRAKGAEFGVRTVRWRGLQSTVAVWYLGLDSELLFVGDAGTTEPGRPSRRVGLEWTNYARIRPWLTLDADVAFTRARFTDNDPAGDDVPGALDRVISAGVSIEPGSHSSAASGSGTSVRARSSKTRAWNPGARRSGTARWATGYRGRLAWCSSSSTSSMQTRRTSTTSTHHGCLASQARSSRTLYPSGAAALGASGFAVHLLTSLAQVQIASILRGSRTHNRGPSRHS